MVLRWRRWKGLPPVHVTAVDYAEPMLAGARAALQRQAGYVELRHADAGALPFDDASFDTANIANAIHCFPTSTRPCGRSSAS
jgi:ubiquinone/menaquinone biosynthesis C-methylase UbiE